MQWNDFVRQGKAVKGAPDNRRADALIVTSQHTMDAAKRIANTSAGVSAAYSALRQLVEAACLRKGFRVYSHEAYTAYLTHCSHFTLAAHFDRFRKIRNGIEYYGENIDSASAKAMVEEIGLIRKNAQRVLR